MQGEQDTVPRALWKGAQNSCNPVFIEVGLRLGVENYYHYFKRSLDFFRRRQV